MSTCGKVSAEGRGAVERDYRAVWPPLQPAFAPGRVLSRRGLWTRRPSRPSSPSSSWPSAEGEPTAEEVRKQDRHKTNAPVTEHSVDDFFSPLMKDQDWCGEQEKEIVAKYASLLTIIKDQ